MTHRFPEQKIPEPEPGKREDDDAREPDVAKRPVVPEGVHPPGRQRG
jgi:hypothetical protein